MSIIKTLRASVAAGVASIILFTITLYFLYLVFSGGKGILSGLFFAPFISTIVLPSLLIISVWNVVFARKYKLIGSIVSIILNCLIVYVAYELYSPTPGIVKSGESVIIRAFQQPNIVEKIQFLLFISICSGFLIGVFYYIESKVKV